MLLQDSNPFGDVDAVVLYRSTSVKGLSNTATLLMANVVRNNYYSDDIDNTGINKPLITVIN